MRFAGQPRPALCGLHPRCCEHILCRQILLYSLRNERTADTTLVQLAAQALRAVTTVGEARGEIGVDIGRIVEGATIVETGDNLGDDAIRHTVPVQFLLHLVGGARPGSEVLHGHGLGGQELLSGHQVCLLLGAQRPPYA
jgi:hypothetical protein